MGSSELGRWRAEAHVQENFSEPASWRKAHSWTSAILFLQEEEEFNSKCIDFFCILSLFKMSGSYSWPLMIPFCTWASRNPPIPTNMLPSSFNPNCSQQLIPIPEINFFVLKCQQNHKGFLEKNYLTASHVVLSGSGNIFKLKLKTLLILNMHLCVDFLLFISPIILQVKPVIFIIF